MFAMKYRLSKKFQSSILEILHFVFGTEFVLIDLSGEMLCSKMLHMGSVKVIFLYTGIIHTIHVIKSYSRKNNIR